MFKTRVAELLIITIIVTFFTGVVLAEEILPLDRIEPGMKGTGKTVFKGTEPEGFPVEIIDIINNSGLGKDLILIRARGKKIDEIGGIAAGMSGTPVYVDNRLIGAIGYGWANTDGNYALVTPIEYMLELFSDLDRKQDTGQNKKSGLNLNYMTELKTPLMVSGLSGRALKRLRNDLSSYDFRILKGSSKSTGKVDDFELEPGSAIAVQLVRGDVNVASIGTLTYRDNNKILAFGHPFTNKGKVNYLLSKAYINSIIPSREQPFKLGSPLSRLLGSIQNDRSSGLAGKLKQYPEIIPLTIKVTDKTRDNKKSVETQIVREERLLTSLGSNIALQAVDTTLDRIGEGTAWVNIKIIGKGLPGLEVNKGNMYYSQKDIAGVSLGDFYQLLNIIATNPFKEIDILDILLEIEVEKKDKVALVQKAEVLNDEIKPGDELNLAVTLHPYRQDPFIKELSLKIPEDINPGMTSVVIKGGFTGGYGQQPAENDSQDNGYQTNQAQIEGYKSFEEMLNEFLDQPDSNDLIVQVYRGYPVAIEQPPSSPAEDKDTDMETENSEEEPGSEEDSGIEKQGPEKKPEIKKVEKTDYVLEGNLTLDIKVVNPKKEEKEKEEIENQNQRNR